MGDQALKCSGRGIIMEGVIDNNTKVYGLLEMYFNSRISLRNKTVIWNIAETYQEKRVMHQNS